MTCDYGLLYGQSSARGSPLLGFLWAATALCQVRSPVYSTPPHTHTQKDSWFKVTQESDVVNSAPGGWVEQRGGKGDSC